MYKRLFTYNYFVEIVEGLQCRYKELVREGTDQYYLPSRVLGWDLAPSASHSRFPYSTDIQGFRRAAPDGSVDPKLPTVAFWGDSLVHGDEQSNEQSWLWKLQERFTGRLRIVNGGVPGYGSDQGLLRCLQRADEVNSKVNFLSYATSDLFRHVNIARPCLNHAADVPFLKPRYIINSVGGIERVNPPYTDFDNIVEFS